MAGRFYGIGVGPGDPELLTIKAQKILTGVDVLCVPKSRMEKESLALTTVKAVVPGDHKLLELEFPMSRSRAVLENSWRQAGQMVAEELLHGRNVAFITIGDPTLYSTYGYLLRYIRGNHPDIAVETIPGVSSITACPAYINEPLVEGEEKLAVIPAAYDLDDLQRIMETFDTVVLMKVNRRLPELVEYFNRFDNIATYFVNRCGFPDQFASDQLDTLQEQKLHYMSLLIVKKRRDY